MNPSFVLRAVVLAAAVLVSGACTSCGESACSKLRDRLDQVETEMGDEAAQSWDDVMRDQELQQEREEIRGEMVHRACD